MARVVRLIMAAAKRAALPVAIDLKGFRAFFMQISMPTSLLSFGYVGVSAASVTKVKV